ncbi:hypothetical protein STEG23_007488, partial [Scotinomys teguina]
MTADTGKGVQNANWRSHSRNNYEGKSRWCKLGVKLTNANQGTSSTLSSPCDVDLSLFHITNVFPILFPLHHEESTMSSTITNGCITMRMPGACGGQERALDSLELELK